MSKIRVSNLAEKLGIDIRETLARLKEIGVEAKAAVSLVEEDAVKKLLTPQPKEGSASTDEVRVTTNIIRRRAKAVPRDCGRGSAAGGGCRRAGKEDGAGFGSQGACCSAR